MSGYRTVLLHFRGGTIQQRFDPPASWADWQPGKIMKAFGALCEIVAAWPASGFDDVLEVQIRAVSSRYVMQASGLTPTPPPPAAGDPRAFRR